MNNKNRGWEERAEIRNQGTPLLLLRMSVGSNIKLKQREDLGKITCQPPQPSLSKAGSVEYD